MSFEKIIVSTEQLKKEMKKHSNARMEKDYERSVKEIDNLFKKTTLFFASTQLEEYKKIMIEDLKKQYEKVQADSKNKNIVENEIKKNIERLGNRLKDIVSNNQEFNISNGYSFASKNIYVLYNAVELLTIRIMDDNKEHFVNITFKSKVPNGFFNLDSFELQFYKKDSKGLEEIIKSNKSYFKEILQNLDLENLGKMVLHFYAYVSKNEHQAFDSHFRIHFKDKTFSNAHSFYNEFIEFKEKILLTHDLQIDFD